MPNEYVVLLHGLGRTANSMNKLRKRLAFEGYKTINIDYPARKMRVEELSDSYLKKILENKCFDKTKKINFVTHSLGGIIVRYFLAHNKLSNINRLVMIAPPNKGSKLADKILRFKLFNYIMGPVLEQLTTKSNSLTRKLKSPHYEVGVIAGKYDGKVSVDETTLENMKDFLIVAKRHTFIMNSREVQSAVVNFLKHGKFKLF